MGHFLHESWAISRFHILFQLFLPSCVAGEGSGNGNGLTREGIWDGGIYHMGINTRVHAEGGKAKQITVHSVEESR